MAKRLYVGNLSYSTTEDRLMEVFGATGVTLPKDHSDRPKGFGFVDIEDDARADELIKEYENGKELDGRVIVVNEARPREERPRDGGGYQSRDNNRGGGSNYR